MQTIQTNTDYINGTEEERGMFRDWVKGALRESIVTVMFTKNDGTLRTMVCTLMEEHAIPHEKTTDRIKEVNDEVCPVWDLEKKAWRSFRYDCVQEIHFILGDEDEQITHDI